jgi:Phage terminase large subunit
MSAALQVLEREIAFSANQFAELQATERWVLNAGGKASGKTFLDALLILKHSGARPEIGVFIGAPAEGNPAALGGLFANDYQQLATAVLPEVFRWLEAFGVRFVFGHQPPTFWPARWKAQGVEIQHFPAKAYGSMLILENGHHVFCSQLYQHHYRRLKSFQFGYAVVEEVSELVKDAIDMVSERVRDIRGPNQVYLHTNPPETDGHWLFEWRDGMRRGAAEGKTTLREIVSTTFDNIENVPADYVDNILASVTPEIAEARILGHWIRSTRGRAYRGFDDNESVAPWTYDPLRPLIIGLDFNWSPAAAGLFQLTDANELRKFDEVHLEAGGTEPVCTEILSRYGGVHRSQVWVYWDATGGSHTANTVQTNHQIVRDSIGKHFRPVLFKSRPSNPLEADRVLTVSAAFCDGKGYRFYKVDPRCVWTVKDYRRMSWIPGTWKLDKTDLSLSHHSDLDGYVICGLRPISRVTGLSAARAA